MLDSVPALRSRARLRLCLFSSFSSRGLGVRRVGLDIDLSYGDAKSVWVNHGVVPRGRWVPSGNPARERSDATNASAAY
jgi:hypothetical protein